MSLFDWILISSGAICLISMFYFVLSGIPLGPMTWVHRILIAGLVQFPVVMLAYTLVKQAPTEVTEIIESEKQNVDPS